MFLSIPGPLRLSFAPDALSWIMVGLAWFMTLAAGLYSRGYPHGETPVQKRIYWLALGAFPVMASAAVMAGDWLTFTLFVELCSLSLFFMIAIKDRKTASMYLVAQLFGAAFLLVGTAADLAFSGSMAMGPVAVNARLFFLIGLGVKGALVGFHFWLPEAHSKAPSPVSALLSGYAVKLGMFGLARMSSGPDSLLIFLGGLMALYGVGQALFQHDAKRLLAYHTVSQLGYVTMAIGTGSPLGIAAAFSHAVAHAFFKGLLFLAVGSLERVYGTRDLRHLGRAARDIPSLFVFFLVGALSISGVPGTSGYASKVLVKASLEGIPFSFLPGLALTLAGIGTVISFCKLGFFGFFRSSAGCKPPTPGEATRSLPGRRREMAMVLPAVGTLTLGIFPLLVCRSLGVPFEGFYQAGKLFSGVLPLLAGAGVFWGFPEFFSPKARDIPDVDHLVRWIALSGRKGLGGLRRLHSGSLRVYVLEMLAVAVGLFWLLQ